MSQPWLPPTLETPRLVLRPVGDPDADAVFAYASNPNLTRYTLWDAHRDLNDTFAFVRDYAQMRYREQVPDPLGICLKEEGGRLVGALGCFWVSKKDGAMELGFALAESYWGRGLTVEAGRALLDHVFAAYPVERVQAKYIEGNDASGRVMRKLGMTFEGTLRHGLFHRGAYKDVYQFSILRGEWPATVPALPS